MARKGIAPVGLVTAPALTGIWAICTWQIRQARSQCQPCARLAGSGLVGGALAGPPLRIAWLGDSLATGLGCDHVEETPARLTARLLERAAHVQVLAVPGARSSDVLRDQLPQLGEADLVVLCVGSNDVASRTTRATYARRIDEILARLAPTPVVMLSLPDMSMPDCVGQPVRAIAGARARWFEAARARVAGRHAHVTSVDIARRPAGLSRQAGRRLLSADRFHPGAEGYRLWAERIATACHALLDPVAAPSPAPQEL